MKIAGDEMRPCSEEEVRRLLPIQAYSQKQLSDVSVRVEELSRFITAPIRAQLDGIEACQVCPMRIARFSIGARCFPARIRLLSPGGTESIRFRRVLRACAE